MGHRVLRTVAVVTLLAVGALPAVAAGPQTPQRDPFYAYTGRTPLARVPPGTVLKSRSIQVAFGTSATPVQGEQLLYRTTGQLGQPTVTVTTVLSPAPAAGPRSIVEYLSFYDGLTATCDPSYALAGGDPGGANSQQAQEEELLLDWYLTNGFTLTVPDFEGEHLDWMAGRESGYGALDAIRATESYLKAGPATGVGLSGYSGGAVAADWASELAPRYAPELHIVGVAEGGIPVNYAHMFRYINGTTVYSAAIPGVLLGLARAYHVELTRYLSAYGQRVVRQEANTCIASDFSAYPGLTYQKLMKPRYRDIFHVPLFMRLLSDQIMGTAPGHPTAPLFMGVGNADGTGDGVMVAADVQALAAKYCHEGDAVQFMEYRGAQHEYAGVFFEPETGAFFQARFAGLPFSGNCASLGSG